MTRAHALRAALINAGLTADPPIRAARQPASHRLRGLPPRAPHTGKARPRATERGNTHD
jgi:hypothetical protein